MAMSRIGVPFSVPTHNSFGFFFFYLFLLLFKYSFLPFPPALPTTAALPPPSRFHPHLVIVHVSFIIVPANPSPFSLIILSRPLWLLSACSQYQCLWLYFACLFVSLIRFQLKVTSYGICP